MKKKWMNFTKVILKRISHLKKKRKIKILKRIMVMMSKSKVKSVQVNKLKKNKKNLIKSTSMVQTLIILKVMILTAY